jgi:hypothetical protein
MSCRPGMLTSDNWHQRVRVPALAPSPPTRVSFPLGQGVAGSDPAVKTGSGQQHRRRPAPASGRYFVPPGSSPAAPGGSAVWAHPREGSGTGPESLAGALSASVRAGSAWTSAVAFHALMTRPIRSGSFTLPLAAAAVSSGVLLAAAAVSSAANSWSSSGGRDRAHGNIACSTPGGKADSLLVTMAAKMRDASMTDSGRSRPPAHHEW